MTPGLLFRGGRPGETLGPYVSQFLLQPAFLGSQPINQQQVTYLPNIVYVTDFPSWLDVQNGVDTGLRNQMDPQPRYRRTTGSFTFGGAPPNPGNPYLNSRCENGFGTFGGPDFAATIGEVAVKALNAAWYQNWFVHLRPRPEAVGGIVHLLQTGQ